MQVSTEAIVFWLLGTLLTAFVGSFLASYLKKKGENLATHEDIGKVLDEVKAVTRATKEIEAKISIDVWSQQQRWDVQKTALLESLKELATAEACLFRLVWTFSNTKDRKVDGWEQRREGANEKYADAIDAFWRTQLAMEIVCGRAIGDQFTTIDRIFALVRLNAQDGEFGQIWSRQFEEIKAAKIKLGEIIRKLLALDPHLGGGELSLSSHVTPQSTESSGAPSPGSPSLG